MYRVPHSRKRDASRGVLCTCGRVELNGKLVVDHKAKDEFCHYNIIDILLKTLKDDEFFTCLDTKCTVKPDSFDSLLRRIRYGML